MSRAQGSALKVHAPPMGSPLGARPRLVHSSALPVPGDTVLAARHPFLATHDAFLHERLPDLAARAVTVALFTLLAVRIGANFLQTGHLTGLLLLVSELLVVALTVFRRRAAMVDRTLRGRSLTALSLLGPPLVIPTLHGALVPDLWTTAASAAGLLVIIAGKLSLGRSFGLVPANRGIVSHGLYRAVRHPIYLGYLVTHVAFLIANPSPWNVALLASADIALVLRAIQEERTLLADPAYAAYQTRVRWRLVPGVF
jgi:protein-S-isoprenylcysteine O-methyltransferase Ste14